MNREKQEYLARAFGCGIHEGDTVRLVRAWKEEEGEHAGCYWDKDMKQYIGKVGKVSSINLHGDFDVEFPESWLCPYFVLEKVGS